MAAVIAAPIAVAVVLACGLLLWWHYRQRRSGGGSRIVAQSPVIDDVEKAEACETRSDDLGPHVGRVQLGCAGCLLA